MMVQGILEVGDIRDILEKGRLLLRNQVGTGKRLLEFGLVVHSIGLFGLLRHPAVH